MNIYKSREMENEPILNTPKKSRDRREYMRAYYSKTKKPVSCIHCSQVFSCRSSLNYHLKNNVVCKIYQMAYICEMEKGEDFLEIIRRELTALRAKMEKGSAANKLNHT
jgi:transcription elongation factor Elf1